MSTFELVVGIILIVFSVFLIVAVLMQEGKSHNLSGTIAGGADTFFGKSKGQTVGKKLSVLTSVVAIIFVVLVCTVYVLSADNKTDNKDFWSSVVGGKDTKIETKADDTKKAEDTTAPVEETTAEETTAEETTAEETAAE